MAEYKQAWEMDDNDILPLPTYQPKDAKCTCPNCSRNNAIIAQGSFSSDTKWEVVECRDCHWQGKYDCTK